MAEIICGNTATNCGIADTMPDARFTSTLIPAFTMAGRLSAINPVMAEITCARDETRDEMEFIIPSCREVKI